MGVARRRRGGGRGPAEAPVEVRIERLAAGGDGVGRLPDGRAIFVPLSAPGDLLRVRIVERRRRFARGEIDALIEPGPDRRSPPCDVFGRCGGCAWQHLDYDAQLASKRRILRDALERIGGIQLADDPPITASPAELGYRLRTRVLEREGAIGYRERRSHRLCAVTSCPVLVPELDAAFGRLAERCAVEWSERSEPGEREWSLCLGAGGVTSAAPTSDEEDGAPLPGAVDVELRVGGDALALSPRSFSQANALLLEDLHRAVVEAAGSGARALELFAGVGFFSLELARRFEHLVAVESNPSAVADLRRNLEASGLRAEPVEGRVEDVLIGSALERPDVVVLDPPRAGLASEAAERLADLEAPRIVYLSCDPATLARDVAVLAGRGYAVESARAFDLFPQTPHVEALVALRRNASG
jgi:23S rRNA (uracil1939-C5)-methyltransferase